MSFGSSERQRRRFLDLNVHCDAWFGSDSFWRGGILVLEKLDNRIYNNELQQAHTDTFMGAVRREIAWMTPDAEWREWTMIFELM